MLQDSRQARIGEFRRHLEKFSPTVFLFSGIISILRFSLLGCTKECRHRWQVSQLSMPLFLESMETFKRIKPNQNL